MREPRHFVDYARRYAELEWALIRADGKKARGVEWQQTTPELPGLAAGKWAHWGQKHNIGIVCGTSGLAIVDVDIDPPLDPIRELKRLLGMDDLPCTPIVRTGSGRVQAYFKDPGGLEKTVRDALELRVGPHMCVAPPSIHPATGRPYRWLIGFEPWTLPLAPLPSGLIEFFQARASRRNGGSTELDPRGIPIGQIDTTLTSLAGTMRRRGMSEEAIYAALVAELPRCEPGHTHTDKDCRRIAKSVARYTPATSPRDLAATSPQVDLATSPLPLREARTNDFASDLASGSPWRAVDIVALAANPPEPPEIIDLFYPGSNHLVSGESEALKTWLLLAAAACELEAGYGVLWVDGDDVGPGALLERLRLLGATDARVGDGFAYVHPDEPLGAHLLVVLDLVHDRRVRLAVFDGFNPLLVLHGLSPNDGVDIEKFYTLIDPIRKAGAANVLTDNVVKSREARGGWAIGSERKRSKAEVHLEMRALAPLVRGGAGRAKLTVRKDRHGHLTRPSPGILVIESGAGFAWRVDPDDSRDGQGEFRPTVLMAKVSQFLERRWDEPQSRNQIEQAKLGGTDHVRVAVDRLIEEGFAQELEGKRGARLVQIVRPFSDEETGGGQAG